MRPLVLTHVFDPHPGGSVATVSLSVHVADTFWSRFRGLHAFPGLQADCALLLWPCRAVHTLALARPIDVVFIDRQWRALQVVSHLKPWRAAFCRRAYAAVELAAGYCAAYPGFLASLPDFGFQISTIPAGVREAAGPAEALKRTKGDARRIR